MTSPARPRGRPPLADEEIHEKAMRLRDAGRSLRAIAEQLYTDHPERFTKPPSPGSITTWADKGEEEYGRTELAPPMIRARKMRRLEALMGKLDAARDAGDNADEWLKWLSAHVLLEREHSRIALPARLEIGPAVVPGVDPATRAKIAATYGEPPRTPIRGVS